MYTRKNWFFIQVIYALCLLGLGFTLQGCLNEFIIQPQSPNLPPDTQPEEIVPEIAKQHALVVGINKYRHAGQVLNAEDGVLGNLRGAVNDAKVIAKALRSAKVDLPDERILLDDRATHDDFMQAWRNMVKEAQPGDTLIVTFSGHGGQELDAEPLDEKKDCRGNDQDHKIDNYCVEKDETLLFHDFHFDKEQHSYQGRITDDELRDLFEEAKAYKIVFVIDACHSAGMMRGAQGRLRSAGFFRGIRVVERIKIPPKINIPPSPTQGDEAAHPKHVTLIMAVHTDNRLVLETSFYGKTHGALSWFFAKALNGEADSDENGYLNRAELERFLVTHVREEMQTKYSQEPKLSPRGDTVAVLRLGDISESPAPVQQPNMPDIAIMVQPNGVAPQNLKHVSFVSSKESVDLRFVVVQNQHVEVFNKFDEHVATLQNNAPHLWQRVIDKERLLKVLKTQFDMRLKPVRITLREMDELHRKGKELHFSIEPGNTRDEGLNALTLFNLASTGELQFLYPLTSNNSEGKEDLLKIKQFPYTLPPMEVGLPFGKDNLVAVLCRKPATGLHTLLENREPYLPEPEQFLKHLRNNRCQVEQYAFFSSE